MPTILEQIPEKARPWLLYGGIGLGAFLLLRPRQRAEEVPTAPPLEFPAEGMGGFAGGAQGVASALSQQMAMEQAEYNKEVRELELESRRADLQRQKGFQEEELRMLRARTSLEAERLRRQTDVVKSKPVSCPHGYEVRNTPDLQPYCRSKSGAVTFGNVIIDPAAKAIKEAVPELVEGYIKQQTGVF